MLGPVESSVGVVQPWPHFVADELVLGLPGCLLLPHHFGLIRLRLHVDDWRRFRQFRPRGHLQTSLPGSMVHLHISARARWQVGSRTPHFLFVFLNNRNSKLIATTPQQTLNKKAVVTQPHVTRNQWPPRTIGLHPPRPPNVPALQGRPIRSNPSPWPSLLLSRAHHLVWTLLGFTSPRDTTVVLTAN